MMHIEPLPCGKFMFGSCLVSLPDRCLLLTAKREISLGAQGTLVDALQLVAQQIVQDLVSQAKKNGIGGHKLIGVFLEDPDFVFYRKKTS